MTDETLRKVCHCPWQPHRHAVFHVTYRKTLVDEEVTRIIVATAERVQRRYAVTMEAISCTKDHMHLLCNAHPEMPPGRVVQGFKSITTREIFRRRPCVKKELWGGEFWADGQYVAYRWGTSHLRYGTALDTKPGSIRVRPPPT